MQNVELGIGSARYGQLSLYLDDPRHRAQRVMQITKAWWWPDGPPVSKRNRHARASGTQGSKPQPTAGARRG